MKKLFPALTVLIGAGVGPSVGLFVFVKGAAPYIREAAAAQGEHMEAVIIPKKPWDFWTFEIEKLSDELEGKLTDLADREADLVAREARMAAAMQELDVARSEIDALRAQLTRHVGELKESEMKNIRTLAATYGDMKPKAALPLLRELSDDTIIKILAVWKPDNVRPLLDEISKNAAADPEMVQRAGIWSERLRLLPRDPVKG
ncbi:MotE family protein [Actomonas aquatica]|uniref:Magnesium transporter MgtE intracellular domain-containing protein n=1 Tax=Actomonas aquatica TaxID=2866162 RepID=A0ABZ1CC71_9BACT|nr:hypothetical protein [Opitutus sp. WL0086]WRQ89278.1 hypothetical protein K1X11_007650 [Opitutus sp. WL0086]